MPANTPTTRQTRRPRSSSSNGSSGAGLGVDRFGGQVIDPTENVLALVDAESRRQDGQLAAAVKRADDLRAAESKRIDDLAGLRATYDKQISDILTVQVKTTSELISTQLDKVTTSLSNQITTLAKAFADQLTVVTKNSSDSMAAMSERVSQVERFRYEYGGRASVSDPATAQALTELAKAVSGLKTAEDTTKGHGTGRSEMIAWMFTAGMFFVAIATAIVTAIHH